MDSKILDGKSLAREIRNDISKKVNELKEKAGITPGLAVVIVGEDPASQSYVRMKEKACIEANFYSEVHRCKESITQDELLGLIHELNHNPKIHGILVQLPLPKHLDEKIINENIVPSKDVDGFSPVNFGNLFLKQPGFCPVYTKGDYSITKALWNPIGRQKCCGSRKK